MQVIDHNGGVVSVLFTRSADDNFIASPQIIELAETLDGVIGRNGLRAVVVAGEGAHFCNGRVGAKGLTQAADIRDDLGLILEANKRLRESPVPFVAAVEGHAFGFGCGFATQCDITIAAADAAFALPEMSHQLPPLVVLSYFGKFLPFKKAFEIALTSREFEAAEARDIGIVTEVVPRGTAMTRALEFARMIGELDAESVRLLRRFARQVAGLADEDDARRGIDAMSIAIAARGQAKRAL
jgi:enoyl-CoA hydratase/carnithine racemase